MSLNRLYLRKMQLVLLVICFVGFIDSNQAQRGSQRFLQPEIDYSPWNPIGAASVEYPVEVKTNKARSIKGSAPEPLLVPKTSSFRTRNNKTRAGEDGSKGVKRRNFETSSESIEKKSEEKVSSTRSPIKRRTTTAAASVQEKSVKAASRFKGTRRPAQDTQSSASSTPKSRRQFTSRSTLDNVLVTTSEAPTSTRASFKRVPFTRGNFRPKPTEKSVDGNASLDEENYPEHFKLQLKNKEVNNENDKSVLKKPLKPYRPSSVDKTTKSPVRTAAKKNVLYPTRSRTIARTTTPVSTTEASELLEENVATTIRSFRRPRPTERTKVLIGSTLQEPPTARATPSYATRSPIKPDDTINVNTQDGVKQIDPPIREYFPRTSAQIGSSLKYSSRFRNSDIALKALKAGSYQPTVPSITTTPSLDLTDIDLERWREILPLAAELVHLPIDAEIMTQSPSQTVSIYEALAEILSKPTESLSLSNSKSTDSTLFSEAPISSTTTTTSTTTTSTTPLPPPTTEANDDFKVENSALHGLENVESVNTARVNMMTSPSRAPTTEKSSKLTTSIDNLTTLPSTLTSYILNKTHKPFDTLSDTATDNTTENTLNDLQAKSATKTFEFSAFSTTTPADLTQNYTENEALTTNNLTSFNNETNAINPTEIETIQINLMLERKLLEELKIDSPSSLIRNIKTTSTVPPNYSPRFSAENRIPILSFGSWRDDRVLDPTTKATRIDLMTYRITKSEEEKNLYSTPSVFPVYRPELHTTTMMMSTMAMNEKPSTTIRAITSTEEITSSEPTLGRLFTDTVRDENSSTMKTELTTIESFSSIENADVTETIVISSFMTVTGPESTTVTNSGESFDFEIATEKSNDIENQTISSPTPDRSTISLNVINEINELTTAAKVRDENISMKTLLTTANIELLFDEETETSTKQTTRTSQRRSQTDSTEETTFSKFTFKQLPIPDDPPSFTLNPFPTVPSYPSEPSPTTYNSPQHLKVPKYLIPRPFQLPQATESPKVIERVVYAILTNNTVVRKTIQQRLTTENPFVIYGIFPNNSVVRKFRNGTIVPDEITTRIEITNIDPKSLTNPNSEFHQSMVETVLEKSALATTTYLPITEQTKTENTSHIIGLLQKLKNETDSLVKSANIFSLAKKSHHNIDESNSIRLDVDAMTNQINEKSQTFKPTSTTKRSTKSGEESSTTFPSTPRIDLSKAVSIFPNGYDILSTNNPEANNDFFDNEIFSSNDDNGASSTTRGGRNFGSTVEYSTKATSTSSTISQYVSSFTTSKRPSMTVTSTEKTTSTEAPLTQAPSTQTSSSFETTEDFFAIFDGPKTTTRKQKATTARPKTTENFINRNVNALQRLLSQNVFNARITTSLPSTIQTTEEVTTTTEIPETTTRLSTTENFIDKNNKILQRLLAAQNNRNSRPSTEEPFEFTTETEPSTSLPSRTTPMKRSSTTTSTTTTTTTTPTTTTTTTERPTTTTTRRTTTTTTTLPTTTTTPRTTSTTTPTTSTTTPSTTTERRTEPTTTDTPSTTRRSTTTTRSTTQKTTKKAPFSDNEDIDFLRQLAKYINRQSPTLEPKKPTVRMTAATTTTSTSTTTTTTTTTTPEPPSSPRQVTIKRPSTYSDADDIAFLSSLRQYANIINLTTERSALANRILELALNRTGKSVDKQPGTNNQVESNKPSAFVKQQSPDVVMEQMSKTRDNINMFSGILKENEGESTSMKLKPAEIERTKNLLQKDITQYNNDIKLLSLLIGRPVGPEDISKLASTNLGKPSVRSVPLLTLPQTTVPVTLRTTQLPKNIPAFKPLSDQETKFLQALQQIQTTLPTPTTSTSTTTEKVLRTVSKSQEAIIAALLRQQGIGPNNQVPIEKILEQLPLNIPRTSTTIRPFSPLPPLRRQPRPILDGLAWLWKTWQETSPGVAGSNPRARPQPPQSAPLGEDWAEFDEPVQSSEAGNGVDWRGGGAQSGATSGDSLSYQQQPAPLLPGGLIGAALGVTRAVTQFLGIAFAGAGQAFQTAFTGGSAGPAAANGGGNYYALSGR